MLDEIRNLLRLLHISDFESSVALVSLALAAAVVGIGYKENFFGFGDWIRRLLRARPSEIPETMKPGAGIADTKPSGTTTDPATEKPLVTSIVSFKTERELNTLDLLKAVQTIRQQRTSGTKFEIPLDYDPSIPALMGALQRLHLKFESIRRIENDEDAAREYNSISNDVKWTTRLHRDLPNKLGLAAARLTDPALGFSDIDATHGCRTYAELEMTTLISCLAKWQPDNGKAILTDYIALDKYDIVAKVSGESRENLVSYRILLADDARERVVLAPRDYGVEDLSIEKEFRRKERLGKPYTPASSFLVEYVFPQMFWNDAPADWNMARYIKSVFVKNLEGEYL